MRRDVSETYKAIMDWGVISWYNYGGRLGMWYNFMDGIETINVLIEEYKKAENNDAVINLMAAHEELKAYMIKEGIWEAGVLPEYKEIK